MANGRGAVMRLFRDGSQTATAQASILFVVAGVLGLITEIFVQTEAPRPLSLAINVAAIVVGALLHVAPWHRWPAWAALATAVPVAFGLLVVGQRLAPGVAPAYGVWFVVVFAWIGFWYPPRTAVAVAPIGAIAYIAPFIGVEDTPPDVIGSVVIVITAAVILGEVISSKMDAIQRTQRDLLEARGLLERASLTDDLTGLGNRRHANALVDSMQPGDAVILLDLDHFKHVNDTMGHAEGDRVLMSMGVFLQAAVRDADTVTRFGGEEFLVLLRGAGADATGAARRLVDAWRTYGCGVTVSAGVALHQVGRSPTDTLRAADAALYEAKEQGRDRVATEGSDGVRALA
jgi:diguanylate cyclase (GGDEF)-like protein